MYLHFFFIYQNWDGVSNRNPISWKTSYIVNIIAADNMEPRLQHMSIIHQDLLEYSGHSSERIILWLVGNLIVTLKMCINSKKVC